MPGAAAVQPRSDGGFADWDYMHGEVEVYNDQGIRITMLNSRSTDVFPNSLAQAR